jgi:general nucleoside transport system ATP-binding protein
MKVELRDIYKSFGPVRASDGLRVTFESGRIYGLLGENGAGKTTLMKILAGFLSLDAGEILIDGRPFRIQSPAQALKQGIGMLQQDPFDFLPFTVLDNFLLGRKADRRINRKRASLRLKKQADFLHFRFDPNTTLRTMTIGERQQLEIIGLLASGVKVLILDEPTTGISASQKSALFNGLRLLAGQGNVIILVSHKLEDIQDLCQRVIILRKGKVAGDEQAPFDTGRLVQLMFGRLPDLRTDRKPCSGALVLELSNFCIEEHRICISHLFLSLRQGEVLGLAGTEGSGRRLFLQGCAGLRKLKEGKIRLCGTDLTGHGYQQFRSLGGAYVPAARLEEGLIRGLDLTDHFLLAEEDPPFVIDRVKAEARASSRIQAFNIIGGPETRVEALSGGNQQRALLALLPDNPSLVLMEHPTRGLDIDSAKWIWDKLLTRCGQGTAILFISSDLDEIMEQSDSILVFSGGQVSPMMKADEINMQQLAEMIGGKGL